MKRVERDLSILDSGTKVSLTNLFAYNSKKMLESRPEDALVKLVKLVNLVKLVKPWRLY